MKSFTSAAVFGLVPVPPAISTTNSCGPPQPGDDNGEKPANAEDFDHQQLAGPRPEDATERMATKDELARIRRQLGTQSAD